MKKNVTQLEKEAKIILNHYQAGDYVIAENKAKKLLKENTNYLFLYNILGLSLSKQEKYDEAIYFFRNGIAIKDDVAILHNNLGNALNAIGKTSDAETSFTKSIKINPKFSLAYNNLGNLLKDQNKFEESLKNFELAAKYQPDLFIAYHNLATVYQYLGKFEKAKECYQKVIEINPEFHLADRQLSLSTKYTKESKHFQKMKKLIQNKNLTKDQKMNLSFGLGKAYEDMKNYDLAFKNYLLGNKIKKEQLNYNITQDKKVFEDIKSNFKNNIHENLKSKSINDKNIIFILGMPRSGTSLVEQILSSHSKVYGAGEMRILNILVRKYFFNERGEFYLDKDLDPKKDLSFQKLSEDYLKEVQRHSANNDFITDKSPLNFLWIGIIKLAFPKAKVIHCVRNSKDNCLSLFKNYFAGSINFSYNLEDIVSYYNFYNELMKFWHNLLPNFIYDISYEQLIQNQEQETKKLIKNCNLEWEENCLLFHKNERAIKTASAAQARKPIYKSSLDSWKNYEKHLGPYFSKLKF